MKTKSNIEKVAIIDMGTNTFHLLLAEILEGNNFNILTNERTPVKLGEGGISDGFISMEAQSRGLSTLKHFKEVIDFNQIKEIHTYATSALRSAKNSGEFLDKVFLETRLSPKIIDGLREAEFIYYGVRAGLELSEKPDLILDIGGGSVEFIVANKREIFWRRSFEIGAQRLKDRFHSTDPIPMEELNALYDYLSLELQPVISCLQKYNPETLIGVAGTFDTLSEIYEISNNLKTNTNTTEGQFSLEAFESIRKELTSKSLAERIATPGLIEFRAGMIVVALAVIDWVLKQNHFKNIRISRYSLKEGILFSIINNLP